jgi:hypothetical protein
MHYDGDGCTDDELMRRERQQQYFSCDGFTEEEIMRRG